jgi:O-antigen ligase
MHAANPARPLTAVAAIVALGVLVALGTVLALSVIGPVKIGFAICGLGLLIPALMVRNPRAYGLFLLTFSIPLDFSIRTTKWLAEPWVLFQQYGLPASGNLSLDIYVTDVVLLAMLVPWLAQLLCRQRRLYFPKIGYIFVLYLAWALIVSLLEAPSLYLALFELAREVLYFVAFLYVANNVVTRVQFRAVVLALLVALVIESGAVITFFAFGIGTAHSFVNDMLYGQNSQPEKAGTLPVAESGDWKHVTRSAGTFTHPSQAAYYFEYILPIVLGYLMAARRARDRILFGAILAAGCVALVLTFSRAGMLGFLVASTGFFPIAWWSRLISRQTFACFAFIVVMAAAVGTPLLIDYLETRPEAVSVRLKLIKPSVAAFLERPIWGAGLNNSSSVTEGSRSIVVTPTGHGSYKMTVVHNHYLIVLVEVGIIGFLLFFTFFWQIVVTAFRHMRAAETEMKILLAGIVSTLGGLTVHNFADPFAGHAVQAMLWLEVGLVFAICRSGQAKPALPASRNSAPVTPPRLQAAAAMRSRS